MSRLEHVTVAWLAQRLAEINIAALVVQFFGGKWVASISLADESRLADEQKTLHHPSGAGATIGDAIDALLAELDKLPARAT